MTSKLETFLFKHLIVKTDKKTKSTHTTIPTGVGIKPKIYGGKYHIPQDELEEFYTLYINSVFTCGIVSTLTEKQNEDEGKIYIDLDFRFALGDAKRHHNKEWIDELIYEYIIELQKLYKFNDGDAIEIYVMERDNGYEKDDLYKDGLHIIFNIEMPRKIQLKLRQQIMNNENIIELMKKLPLTNSLDDVFDKGLSTGATNSQLFGSQKPNCKPYNLTTKKIMTLDGTDNEFCEFEEDVTNKENFLTNFKALSVQTKGKSFELSNKAKTELLKLELPTAKSPSPSSIANLPLSAREAVEEIEEYKGYVNIIHVKDINYYPNWSKLVWAFHSMGDKFKPIALMMTKRSPLYQEEEYFNKIWDCAKSNGKATKEYIWGFAKRGDPDEYLKIRLKFNSKTKNIFKNACVSGTELLIANLFIELFGDNYKCVSSKIKIFHEFNDWVNGERFWKPIDGSYKIQNKLEDIINSFREYSVKRNWYLSTLDKKSDEYSLVLDECKSITKTITSLESSGKISGVSKFITNKVMDEDFEKGMNKVKDYLIPIKNNKMFNTSALEKTDRTIDDKFNYYCDVDFKKEISDEEMTEMDDYFKALFNNNDGTKQIMVTIFKSIFSGVTFRNIFFFTGDGSNGKSLLFKLLNRIFGKAMDIISNDVLIQKKGGSSSINTELAKLQTTLLGYITELKEIDELNTTNVKKISGGDPMDYRGLFNGNKTIIPTTNLCALTNKMPHFEVEPAIMKRMVVVPMNNVFEIDPNFETKMLGKIDLLFTYIMKQGKIITSIKDSDLTDEMKTAIKDYEEDNFKDYLGDFIKRHYKNVDWNEKEMTKNEKKNARTSCDEFLMHYKQYLKDNNYRHNYDTKNKFSRNMKKYHQKNTYQSHCKPYYTGFVRKYGEDEEDEEDEE
jgi:phage/plasmid-associated DNA primase